MEIKINFDLFKKIDEKINLLFFDLDRLSTSGVQTLEEISKLLEKIKKDNQID